MLIVVLNLVALYGINIWNRGIFDALEKYDAERVFWFAMLYVPLLVASVVVAQHGQGRVTKRSGGVIIPSYFFKKSHAQFWNPRRESLLCVAQTGAPIRGHRVTRTSSCLSRM
jgi:ABC-type uncharacterized transport system fused permease/ATPase subunit